MALVSFRLPTLRMLVTARVGGVWMVPSLFFTAGVKVVLLEVPPVMLLTIQSKKRSKALPSVFFSTRIPSLSTVTVQGPAPV